MTYIEKPTTPNIIEAFKWTADIDQIEDPDWANEAQKQGIIGFINDRTKDIKMVIRTLRGNIIADRGDYIIQNANGEIYSCKEEVFNQMYEEVKGI